MPQRKLQRVVVMEENGQKRPKFFKCLKKQKKKQDLYASFSVKRVVDTSAESTDAGQPSQAEPKKILLTDLTLVEELYLVAPHFCQTK